LGQRRPLSIRPIPSCRKNKSDLARVLGFGIPFDSDADRVLGEQPFSALRPLDQDDPAGFEIPVQPDILDFLDPVEPIKIEMINGEFSRIFLNQRKRGTRDIIRDSQTGADSLNQRRLAAAQIAGQRDHVILPKKSGKRLAQTKRLVGASG
jgi:hypothetical protein